MTRPKRSAGRGVEEELRRTRRGTEEPLEVVECTAERVWAAIRVLEWFDPEEVEKNRRLTRMATIIPGLVYPVYNEAEYFLNSKLALKEISARKVSRMRKRIQKMKSVSEALEAMLTFLSLFGRPNAETEYDPKYVVSEIDYDRIMYVEREETEREEAAMERARKLAERNRREDTAPPLSPRPLSPRSPPLHSKSLLPTVPKVPNIAELPNTSVKSKDKGKGNVVLNPVPFTPLRDFDMSHWESALQSAEVQKAAANHGVLIKQGREIEVLEEGDFDQTVFESESAHYAYDSVEEDDEPGPQIERKKPPMLDYHALKDGIVPREKLAQFWAFIDKL
ncbi:hypothetical protein TWF481_002845 [Arthrobotrys musiformis]|uniref:Uncharacterized protein n=1 Tax=Arthrobotrys musiformis TaxID=47236 RepID=A0AAV9VTE9_9PEZI